MLLCEFHNTSMCFIHDARICFPAYDGFLFGFCLFATPVYFSNLLFHALSPSSFISVWEAQFTASAVGSGWKRLAYNILKQKVLNKSDFSNIWPVSYEFENELKFSSRQFTLLAREVGKTARRKENKSYLHICRYKTVNSVKVKDCRRIKSLYKTDMTCIDMTWTKNMVHHIVPCSFFVAYI